MGPEGPPGGSPRLTDKPENLNELIVGYIARFSAPAKHVKLLYYSEYEGYEQRVSIFTDRNEYLIHGRWGDQRKERGYLGCIARSRKPRAGEDWHRGSDLGDGPFTYGTWFRILGDIVSYEMVLLAKPARPVADTTPFSAGATLVYTVDADPAPGLPQSPAADQSG